MSEFWIDILSPKLFFKFRCLESVYFRRYIIFEIFCRRMKKSIVGVINVLIYMLMYVLLWSTSIFYSFILELQIEISYVSGQYRICVYSDRFKITFSPIAPDFVFLGPQGTRYSPMCRDIPPIPRRT